MRILMVCLGNICRSPIAEGVLRFMAEKNGLQWIIDSAGTEPHYPGDPPHRFSQKVCLEHGIDISGQRARRFIAADFNRYDKIYAMDNSVYEEIKRIGGKHAPMSNVDYFLNELSPGHNRSVPDPWYGQEEGYLKAYELIEMVCAAIIKKWG